MSNKRYSTPKDVIKELDYDYFNPYNTDIERVLLSLEKKDPFDQQIEFSGQCLRRFWEKYSRRHIAKILESFPRIQRALFGLEEDISEGTRYRDHYIPEQN